VKSDELEEDDSSSLLLLLSLLPLLLLLSSSSLTGVLTRPPATKGVLDVGICSSFISHFTHFFASQPSGLAFLSRALISLRRSRTCGFSVPFDHLTFLRSGSLPSFHVAHMERAAAARSPCFFAAIADMVVSRWVCDDNGCFFVRARAVNRSKRTSSVKKREEERERRRQYVCTKSSCH